MKKVLLPFVAAALALGASAQLIPNTFNYQGVCAEKGTSIDLRFEVIDSETFCVYQEEQTAETTAAGTFTAVVGKGTATRGDWNNIDWTASEYSLVTFINGSKVATCPFQAVPYANVAGTVAGLAETQQDVLELTEDNMSNKAALAQLKQDFDNVVDNLEMLTPVIDVLLEAKDATEEGLANTQQDVLELTEDNMSNKAAIAQLQQDVEELGTSYEQYTKDLEETLLESFNETYNELEGIKEGMANTQQDVLELTEDNMSNKAAIAQLQIDVEALTAEFTEVADLNNPESVLSRINAGMGDLQEQINLLYSEDDGPVAAVTTGLTQLSNVVNDLAGEVTALQESLNITQGDLVEIAPQVKSNTAGLAALQADFDNVVDNLEMLTPVIDVLLEAKDANADAIEALRRQIANNAAAIGELQKLLNK